jgi:prepilin-type N-terminal cleavage/methylation domain-containing protein/prepilin-type processing-associated H-X9-DG protein
MNFTLIELLIVIAIIAILAAMLLPSLAKARDTALLARCTGNFKQYATALGMYVHDYEDYLGAISVHSGSMSASTGGFTFPKGYNRYFANPDSTSGTEVMLCPITKRDYPQDNVYNQKKCSVRWNCCKMGCTNIKEDERGTLGMPRKITRVKRPGVAQIFQDAYPIHFNNTVRRGTPVTFVDGHVEYRLYQNSNTQVPGVMHASQGWDAIPDY